MRGLLKTIREPSIQLGALEPNWAPIKRHIETRRRDIAAHLPPDDPIKLSIDLLTPIGCAVDENLHTRALAFLCDEHKPHGLQRSVLINILRKIKTFCPRDSTSASAAARSLYMLNRKGTEVDVKPEYRHDTGRCDVWIKLRQRQGHALIVIENKIGAPVRADQLAGYKAEASTWCKRHHAPPALLVLLARKEAKQKDWVNLNYLQLASALREAWLENNVTIGRAWLGMYIASITAGVLDIDVNNRPEDINLIELQAYMGESFGSPRGDTLVTKKLAIPAISREFVFYVRNASVMDEIYGNGKVKPSVRELTETVYDRAEATMYLLLKEVRTSFRSAVHNLFRAKWEQRISREEWEWWAPIYSPGRGPRKRIGSVGFWVSFRQKDPALVGWARLRGGVKGQDELLRTTEKIDGVTRDDNYVYWFDQPLKLTTTRDELQRDIQRKAKAFFRAAKPLLE